MSKPFYTSKTVVLFAVVVAALAVRLVFGVDLGTGIDEQAATTGVATSVLGILLRFITNSAVSPSPVVPTVPAPTPK